MNEYLYYDVKSCIRIDKNRALWERKKGDLAPMKRGTFTEPGTGHGVE